MVDHNVSIRCLTLNINGGFVQKSSVLDELVSKHDVICLQEHLLSKLSISLLDATYVNSALRSLLLESSDYFLAVKVDNVFIYNIYLPTDYHNDTSERLFALCSEKLCKSISSIISSNSACLIVGNFDCNLTAPSARSSLVGEIFDNHLNVADKDFHIHSQFLVDIQHRPCCRFSIFRYLTTEGSL